MRKGKLFVITAPSGAGKSTLIDILMESLGSISFSVSFTTRKKRKEEREGKDYRFVDTKTFLAVRNRGGFLEWAHVFGDLYGTPKMETERMLKKGRDVILDIDVQGAAQIRKIKKDAVFIFILPPDYRTLRRRLEKRKSESDERIRTRLMTARKDVRYFRKFDYIVVNDRIERASDVLKGIFLAERAKTSECMQKVRKIVSTFK